MRFLAMNPSLQATLNSPKADGPTTARAELSAAKAGWICLILGFLTFWVFGFGFVFFVAAFIVGIVAMCTNEVDQGIALLVSSVASSIICFTASIFLLSAIFSAALVAEGENRVEENGATTEKTRLQVSLEPAKRSLVVNLNTASRAELQSLPNIGPVRADAIIAHRPYKSIDDLSQLKGISPRIADELRPFAKTEGPTEKISPGH